MSNAPVRGTYDLFDCAKYNIICDIFREHMKLYNFSEIKIPILEHKNIYITAGDDTDVMKEMYCVHSVNDTKNDITLRAEGTASCIRAVLNQGIAQQRNKFFYLGSMFRHNRPQYKRLREFTQLGCEHINANNIYYTYEIIECLSVFLNKIKINHTIRINSLCGQETLSKYKKNVFNFLENNKNYLSELNKNRLYNNVLRLIDQLSEDEKQKLSNIPKIIDYATKEELNDFDTVLGLLKQNNIQYAIDPFLVRGLDYYNSIIFEVFAQDSKAIAGGGFYKANNVNGIGWALGLERVIEESNVDIKKDDLYIIIAMNNEYGLKVAHVMREKNIKCEIIFNRKFQDSIKKAQLYQPNYLVLCDDNDAKNNIIRVRNWSTKEEKTYDLFEFN